MAERNGAAAPAPLRVSRRWVLKAGAVGWAAWSLRPLGVRAAAAPGGDGGRVLVLLFQRGAADGLNMVVPHGEPRYYDLRPGIAVPPPGAAGGAIDLDGFFGLHPAMAPLEPFFRSGELAAVHACGSPHPTRSHFDAQDFMENGVPGDKSVRDGWLNRYLQAEPRVPPAVMRAVAWSGGLPRMLAGAAPALAFASLDQLSLGRGPGARLAEEALRGMYGRRRDLLGAVTRDALDAVAIAEGLPEDPQAPEYPASPLGRAMRELARLILAGVGVEVACVDTGGWDTHTAEGGAEGTLAGLLGDLAGSLAAFRAHLGERFADVAVLTMTEFGRTVRENGSGGTDHGHGTAMLAFGGTVRGGRVAGRWPGLAEADLFEGRDLEVTTDFRSLFAEALARHLGTAEIASVFPGFAYDPASGPGVFA